MNPKRKNIETRVAVIGGLSFCALLVAVLVVISYSFTDSLNPFRVYSVGTTTQIVIVSVLLTFIGMSLLGVLGHLFQAAISGTHGPDPRVLIGINICIIIVLIIACSYWRTGSLNPISVFRTGNVVWIVIVAILLGVLSFAIVQFILACGLIWRIEADTQNSYRDVHCKFCDGEILVLSAFKKKIPIKCPHCKEWVHTICMRNAGGSLFERCSAPECRRQEEMSGVDDIFRNL
jgi:phage FluMu protein Com